MALSALAVPVQAQEVQAVPGSGAPKADEGQAPVPTSPSDKDAIRAGTIPVPAPPADAALPQVDPIIPDAEFNSAVPTLNASDDAALDQPLESIQSFERRIAAEQTAAKPTEGQAPPANDPALADGDAVEEIGDAPVADAELAAPLPPINQFEVAPVQFAEDEEAASSAPFRLCRRAARRQTTRRCFPRV
jgi:translocation and assembly module TamA